MNREAAAAIEAGFDMERLGEADGDMEVFERLMLLGFRLPRRVKSLWLMTANISRALQRNGRINLPFLSL